MARILRGEIRWAQLDPARGNEQTGQRPVLILSQDVFNSRSGTVIAMALTSQEPRAGFPLTLESRATGLPKQSWIKISQIRTLATERLQPENKASPAPVGGVLSYDSTECGMPTLFSSGETNGTMLRVSTPHTLQYSS